MLSSKKYCRASSNSFEPSMFSRFLYIKLSRINACIKSLSGFPSGFNGTYLNPIFFASSLLIALYSVLFIENSGCCNTFFDTSFKNIGGEYGNDESANEYGNEYGNDGGSNDNDIYYINYSIYSI